MTSIMNKNLWIPPPTYILIGYNLINKKTTVTFLTVVCSTQLQRARYISKAPASRQCRAYHITYARDPYVLPVDFPLSSLSACPARGFSRRTSHKFPGFPPQTRQTTFYRYTERLPKRSLTY